MCSAYTGCRSFPQVCSVSPHNSPAGQHRLILPMTSSSEFREHPNFCCVGSPERAAFHLQFSASQPKPKPHPSPAQQGEAEDGGRSSPFLEERLVPLTLLFWERRGGASFPKVPCEYWAPQWLVSQLDLCLVRNCSGLPTQEENWR